MKKLVIGVVTAVILQLALLNVHAQTTTVSVTPKISPTSAQSAEDKLIETFKEKVATKVAELQKKNDKPIVGRVVSVKNDTIDLQAKDGKYSIKVDENLTKIFSLINNVKKAIDITDLVKGDYIIAEGPQLDKIVTANVIYRDEEYFVKSGKVTEVNTADGDLKVVSTEKDVLTLDIPDSLRMQMVNSKTLDIESISMSKIKEGDTIHFVYKKTGKEKEENRFNAQRILIIPQEFFQK